VQGRNALFAAVYASGAILDAFDNKNVEGRLKQDGDKTLRQALMHWFTGDNAYRANAMNIIRGWSKMDPRNSRSAITATSPSAQTQIERHWCLGPVLPDDICVWIHFPIT
jgi:hypothetical protein